MLFPMTQIDDTSKNEELFNTITQGIGTILSIIGLMILIHPSVTHGIQLRTIGNAIYGFSLILMFLSSSLFHGFFYSKANSVLKILDHAAIFILIAGSFTPLNLALLHGYIQISTMILIWLVVIIGIIYTVFYIHKSNILLIIYLALGWLGLIFIFPLLQETSVNSLILFLSGGAFFTLGTIFFKWKKLLYHHGIWHLFIIAGCIFHFIMIINL
jgi:hemolysin III